MWMKIRSKGLCAEEAQGLPTLHGSRRGLNWGARIWGTLASKQQLETGREKQETMFLGNQRKNSTSKKSFLVGCGQDISRNMISAIDFESGPCSVLQLPSVTPDLQETPVVHNSLVRKQLHGDEGGRRG